MEWSSKDTNYLGKEYKKGKKHINWYKLLVIDSILVFGLASEWMCVCVLCMYVCFKGAK
jgi:hypothetical protein